jgi:hypothetical protein
MDACDPGLDISNLKTLIKQNAGIDLKLSKNQICDVYSLIQGGKLPLPPLILSKDGSYLVDAKSPLTRKDFDTLFSSTSRVSEIRRIAKKVGVVRYADKKLTKQQLTDIIGRRLHSMNVHEPVKLRSVHKKQIEKNAFNNNVNLVNNLNVNRVTNNVNNVNNGTRLNNNVNNGNNLNKGNNGTRLSNNLNNGTRLNNNLNNGTRLSNNLNNGTRLNNNLNRGNNLSSKIKKNEKPRFLNGGNIKTSTNNIPKSNIKAFTSKKPKRPAFLNKSFIKTNKIKPKNGYVFKKGNKGLGMYENVKVTEEGPVQGPARGPIEGPKALENRNREIKENEILLRSYLNRENVGKYINNSEKTNVYNRVKQGTKFNNVKTYINGIVSTKITNEQRIQNQKIKLEQNRNELQKILSELTNLTNTNKNEILGKFNSNGKLNNAKTLAIQKDRDIKKSKLENLKSNLTTFLENKNVNNKGTYINRLNAGEDISNLKREILGVINKKNAERKNYDLKLRELSVLLNSSKNLNNSMKAKFLRNFEKTRNFNKVRKNVEDEFKKINNARKQGEITFRNADQKKLLQKILNNSKNFTNDDKREFMQRLEAGNNFNTLKEEAIQAARNLSKKRKNRELEQKMKAEAEYKNEQRREQRKLMNKIMNNSGLFNNAEKNVFTQRFNSGNNFNTLKTNVINKARQLKEERVRKEKEMLENQEKKRIRNEQQRLLSKILNNSKNMTNENKLPFLQRFNKGENFNVVKGNAIRKAQNLKRNRLQKEKNELNRKAKEEENRLAKEEANRLAKEKANQNAKNEANRLAKEKANQNAKNEANREGKESKRLFNEAQEKKEANRLAKNEANRLAKEEANKIQREKNREEKRRRLTKILGNSKNLTNEDKAAFLKRFENGENVNTVKANAISKAKELAKLRKNKEETNRLEREKEEAERIAREREEKRLAKEEAKRLANEKAEKKLKEKRQKAMSKLLNSSKNLTNMNKMGYLKRFENGENYNALKQNVVGKIRNLANQRKKAKEEANRLAKEEANKKEREKKQQLLSKILNNSKNLTNTNKVAFLKRFEKGENFNTIKSNAISKAKELASQRKKKEEEERKAREKEEANRKAKEEMIAKKKEEALAKKKKEDEEKKKKEAENKKKAVQNTQMRASLTKKVKETQMNQKVKNKLLNQLKNYSVQIRNVAPGIEQTIKSEKLNGNYDEAANKKKRQEVKKQLATYISTTYPNMSKADRKKYINSANLTQWRKGILTGSSGMGANQAFERIKGNMERNMKAKKPPPPPINKKANLKKLVNNTMKGRAAKNVDRLKKNINEGISEMAVKTRIAQLNKQTKYQTK